MLKLSPLVVLLALVLACAGIWAQAWAPRAQTVAELEPAWFAAVFDATPAAQDATRVAALVGQKPPALALMPRTRRSGCRVVGPLPDPACSPGAVFAAAGTSTICVVGYTKGVRSVSAKLKAQLYAAYGIAYPQKTGTYELDHLIPLELGGSNDAANLFPEAAATTTGGLGFKEKDVVEDYLHQEVCAGHVSLPQAQAQIAQDWTAVYALLSPQTIKEIRSKYRSWAD